MLPQVRRLASAFALAFAALALAAGYWSLIRRDALLTRTDNPRRVLAERSARRGTIYDRRGAVLAESQGAAGAYTRVYPDPDLAPVLGYISAFYGSAGVEAAADGVLHGDAGYEPLALYWRDTVLADPPAGRGVTLSLDLRLQRAADAELGPRAGAIVLLDARSGEILAMASHPTFDANQLDADWPELVAEAGAPLLNRATFALYQPGGVIMPLVLGTALAHGVADLSQAYPLATQAVVANAVAVPCRVTPGKTTLALAEAFQYGCPAPFADLGRVLGDATLWQLFSDFRLWQPPALPIPVTAAGESASVAAPELAAIGQGPLTVTPLHMALAAAALARHGEMPAPILITSEQDVAGAWRVLPPASHPIAALPPDAADTVKALMPDGYSALASSGAEGGVAAWFLGFAPFSDARYAVAVLLEAGDAGQAKIIGRRLLQSAIDLAP